MTHPEPWPLRRLVLRTPRLELRPDGDEGLHELVAEAHRGIHPPEQMPFLVPWTEADPALLGRNTMAYHWSERASLAPERWRLHFLVRLDGRVIGTQGLSAADFAITRQVDTGSWIGLRHQGRGLGTEMRAAVLAFAFDHLGATRAQSGAFVDNVASRRVSARLGYRPDGSLVVARRGEPAQEVRLLVTPETFLRPSWAVAVDGLDGCRPLLGAERDQPRSTPRPNVSQLDGSPVW